MPPGGLSLACVMSAADIQGNPGDAVRALAQRLGIRRTRFRPLLPRGRGADWNEPPVSEALGAHSDPMELLEAGFPPVSSCGLGQNLYVEPSGESFPCYAYHQPHSYLGNVIARGLDAILKSAAFKDLSNYTVDTKASRQNKLIKLCGTFLRHEGRGGPKATPFASSGTCHTQPKIRQVVLTRRLTSSAGCATCVTFAVGPAGLGVERRLNSSGAPDPCRRQGPCKAE